MTIMTINTHSYIEENADTKLKILADAILRIKPDLIAMQEINQHSDSEYASTPFVYKEYGIKLKKDNYALKIAEILDKNKYPYSFVWVGIKKSFDIYDEGVCIFTREIPEETNSLLISKTNLENNWKKRMSLGVKINGDWFYNLHMGRWDDNEEPFSMQWKCLMNNINTDGNIWLLGDFNSPSDVHGEGYELVLSDGWYDTYVLARSKDDGYTVLGKIDGWKDKKEFAKKRIDYIFCNKPRVINTSHTIFNGKNEEIISDHFGVIVTY